MEFWMLPVICVLLSLGFYLLQQKSVSRLLLGLLVLSNAVNLLLFTGAGLTRGMPPLVSLDPGAGVTHADPLPQALILTAIVISMGVLAFSLCLAFKLRKDFGIESVDELSEDPQ